MPQCNAETPFAGLLAPEHRPLRWIIVSRRSLIDALVSLVLRVSYRQNYFVSFFVLPSQASLFRAAMTMQGVIALWQHDNPSPCIALTHYRNSLNKHTRNPLHPRQNVNHSRPLPRLRTLLRRDGLYIRHRLHLYRCCVSQLSPVSFRAPSLPRCITHALNSLATTEELVADAPSADMGPPSLVSESQRWPSSDLTS